jgi:hypothetical protein
MHNPSLIGESWLSCDTSLAFEAPALCDMLAIWLRQRGSRAMPRRADLPPECLRGHLGWIVLLDVEYEPLRFRYRLVGTRITELVGRDATGVYLDELYEPAIHSTAISAFKIVIASRSPVRAHGYLRHANKGHLAFEAIDMPLSEDGATVSLIMTRGFVASAS